MKTVLTLLLVLTLVVAFVVPALAQSVDTEVVVQSGGGELPLVKCKWETPDADPALPGTQINPPVSFGATVPVQFWAVVTDEEDNGHVGQVYADVYHPAGPPENGSFKYEVPMQETDKFAIGIPEFTMAYEAGLVTFGPNPETPGVNFTYEEVLEELEKCTAEVWMGSATLHYHQPAGDYLVKVAAIDQQGNNSAWLDNTFEYVAVSAIEIDFDGVSYGGTMICQNKWVAGDTEFGTMDLPTVRNIGNTAVYLLITQGDMGFGQDVTGMWNVEFDARLGNDPANAVVYLPEEEVQLPNKLPLCNTDELDFSIHVKKGTSGQSYIGAMTITCLVAPF